MNFQLSPEQIASFQKGIASGGQSPADNFKQGQALAGTTQASPAPSVSSPEPTNVPESGAPQPPQGFLSQAWDVAKGAAAGLLRSPLQGAGEALDAGKDIYNSAQSALQPYLTLPRIDTKASAADYLSARNTLGQVGNSSVNQAVANIVALGLGGEALGGLKVFSALPGIARGALAFGAATGLMQGQDHNGERLANSLQTLGLDDPFTHWLASDPSNESALEARFKNAVDGTVGGAAGAAIFKTSKWAIAALKGGAADGLAKDAAEAAKQVTPESAQPATLQTQMVSGNTSAAGASTGVGTSTDASAVQFKVKPAGSSDDAWRDAGGPVDKGDLDRLYASADTYAKDPDFNPDVNAASAPELHQGIGQKTITTFKAPEDVPAFMRAVLDRAPAMDRPMSDADLKQQVAQGAAALGVDQNLMGAFMANVATEASRLPQAVGIARTMWQGVITQLRANAAKGTEGLLEGSPELTEQLATARTASMWAAHYNDLATGLGRGLRAFQLGVDSPEVEGKALDDAGMMAPVPNDLQSLDKFYKLLAAAGTDNTAAMDLLRGKLTVPSPGFYLRNSLASAYTGSLLAGKAIVKGYMMPAFMGALQTVERTVGGGLAAMNPFLDQETRQAAAAIAKSTPLAYFQTIGDLTSAFRYSIDAMRNGGRSVIGGQYSAFNNQRFQVTQEMLDAAGKSGDLRYSLGNAINVWPRAVFSLVGGHDELTKRLSYLGRVRMTAMSQGLQDGLSGQDLDDAVRGAIKDAVDPSGAATQPAVLNEAARTSFINTPDGPSKQLIGYLNQLRNSVPELRYILPVLDVPASGLGEAIRRIPGVSYMFQQTRDDLLGNNGTISQAEAYGRWITGTTLLGSGFGLARAGLLTGAGPNLPQDKAAWENSGYQPYSFRFPNGQWVSYKDWEPVGSILGLMGNMYDHSVHYAEDDQMHNKFLASAAALSEYAKDKAAMQSVSALLSFGDQSTSPDKWVQRQFGGIASGFEPAFLKYARNADDPSLRAKDSVWDHVMDGIPGGSQQLPPIRNTFGEPIHSPNDASNMYGLMPWTISTMNPHNEDPETAELDKVYQLTGYAGGMTHPQELSKGHFDAQGITLENGQRMFDRFAQMRMDPDEDGATVRSKLADLFQSDEYKEAVYGSATRTMDPNTGDESKLAMIHRVFQQADAENKQRLAQESPIARRYLAVAQAKSDSPDALRTHSADELVTNPPLLKSLGINIEDYENNLTGQ